MLLLDLYDPVQLEHLARIGSTPTATQIVEVGYVRRRLQYLIRRADHVLCASPPQRAHWLGWMGACGRLSPQALAGDPEASRLIAIVPFGVPEAPPRKGNSPLRRAIGAAPGEPIALWAGGLWDWMDPALAVRATAIAQRRLPRLKLLHALGGQAMDQPHVLLFLIEHGHEPVLQSQLARAHHVTARRVGMQRLLPGQHRRPDTRAPRQLLIKSRDEAARRFNQHAVAHRYDRRDALFQQSGGDGSGRVGFGLRARKSVNDIRMPGVQNPHCRA